MIAGSPSRRALVVAWMVRSPTLPTVKVRFSLTVVLAAKLGAVSLQGAVVERVKPDGRVLEVTLRKLLLPVLVRVMMRLVSGRK
jgi:hypothetical protein